MQYHCRHVAAFDPEQLGVMEGFRLRRGGASLPHIASPNEDLVNLADTEALSPPRAD